MRKIIVIPLLLLSASSYAMNKRSIDDLASSNAPTGEEIVKYQKTTSIPNTNAAPTRIFKPLSLLEQAFSQVFRNYRGYNSAQRSSLESMVYNERVMPLLIKTEGNIQAALLLANQLPTSDEKESIIKALNNLSSQPLGSSLAINMAKEGLSLDQMLEKSILDFEEGSDKKIKVLLKAGANINQCNKGGKTLLHRLVNSQKIEEGEADVAVYPSMDLLIENGAIINSYDRKGNTPLLSCVKNGVFHVAFWEYVEIMNKLLKAGANPKALNKESQSALMIAIKNGYFLGGTQWKNGEPEYEPDEFTTSTILTTLLKAGAQASINHQNLKGDTAVGMAVKKWQKDLAGKVPKAMQYPPTCNTDSEKDRKYNIARNYPAVVSALVEHGADASIPNNEGKNAFDYAGTALTPYLSKKI